MYADLLPSKAIEGCTQRMLISQILSHTMVNTDQGATYTLELNNYATHCANVTMIYV